MLTVILIAWTLIGFQIYRVYNHKSQDKMAFGIVCGPAIWVTAAIVFAVGRK